METRGGSDAGGRRESEEDAKRFRTFACERVLFFVEQRGYAAEADLRFDFPATIFPEGAGLDVRRSRWATLPAPGTWAIASSAPSN